MKFALPAFALLAVLVLSCDDNPSTPPPPVTDTHVIRDIDYVKNKYFYFDDPSGYFIGPRLTDSQILVFRTVLPADIVAHPEINRFPAWLLADPVGDGQEIRDAADLLNANEHPSPALINDVELLTLGEDYNLVTEGPTQQVIAIELVDPIPDAAEKALAVSYINVDDVAVGGSYSTLGVNRPMGADTLMLELIKAPDPTPYYPFGSTWRLAVRNVYDLGWKNIDPTTLAVRIEDLLSTTRLEFSTPEGSDVHYLRIFGLDQTDRHTGSGPPDGLIDLGFVDAKRGLLFMPDVHAFAPDPAHVTAWTSGLFAFTGQYQAQYDQSMRIYTERLSSTGELDVHQYIIRATATIPPP